MSPRFANSQPAEERVQKHSDLAIDQPVIIADYDAAMSLRKAAENIGLSSADDRDQIGSFVKRNPGLSKVLVDEGGLVGTILCGHDGRRGYLYHLCVDRKYRRRGAGTALVDACLWDLRKQGIRKCHLFVFDANEVGKEFWKASGWQLRRDINVFSKDI